MKKTLFLPSLLITLLCFTQKGGFAQAPSWTIDLLGKEKKPEKFTERKLGSEKMADKKFTLLRKFFQNNYTRYNYYFNANNKINLVIEKAKASQTDDFSKPLSYYPYSLDVTSADKTELDSVIYKATAGILIHDLRNSWIDDMYLLMGKAYFLRKDFDSAASTFQFINYNLFPRKKNEDDSRVVGTADNEKSNVVSIANPEKMNIIQKTVGKPPSRNDALLWLARTFIERDEMGEAAGLISTLKNDPNLPKRLQDDLNELNGYWFFKQNNSDSAAAYLEKSLSVSENKQDLSRAEFQLAQMFESTGNFDKASLYYNKASVHTTNALLDIHAQLNNAKMMRNSNPEELDKGIKNLTALARRDKFSSYRDIIYYSAGDIAMQKPDTAAAIGFFSKSMKYNSGENVRYKNKCFLAMGEIAYNRRQYKDAYRWYDSLQTGDTSLNDRLEKIQARRNSLAKIAERIFVIEKQDSLQRIAAMPQAAREAFVKKLSKKLRKERGLKEEDTAAPDLIEFASQKNEPVDLFASSSAKGEWYFYNSSARSKGFGEFKRKWGTRTNADNWRRKNAAAALPKQNVTSDVDQDANALSTLNPDDASALPADVKKDIAAGNKNGGQPLDDGKEEVSQPEDISYEGLMSGLPLTKEKLDESNNLLATNLYELGNLLKDELEDYEEAIFTYDSSLKRYPDSLYEGGIYFGLYYCYNKLGDAQMAAKYKNLLAGKFADSKAYKLLTKPALAKPELKNPESTKRYEKIYNLFIEGKFEEALAEKKTADSLYGNSYWTPQLLYIEAVYHVRQKEDTLAIETLNNIVLLYPKSKLKEKAETMIDVLGRRKEIEEYLTKLEVTRAKEDEVVVTERPRMVRNDSNLVVTPKSLYDSLKNVIPEPKNVTVPEPKNIYEPDVQTEVKPVPTVSGPYVFTASAPHFVLMVLDKVDVTYVNESRNAFRRFISDNYAYRSAGITAEKDTVNKDLSIIIFNPFANLDEAMQFLTKAKKAAPDEVSWLPANKYSFIVIDEDNLQRLKNTKDLKSYMDLLKKQFPGQF